MARPRKLERLTKNTAPAPIARGRGAERVFDFFARHLTHQEGEFAGKRFDLLPWQRDQVIRPLFGTLRPDGLRQYRTAFLELPRKQGKTSLSAGLALYLLLGDEEPASRVFCVAGDLEQANLVFALARYMVEAAPQLRPLIQSYRRELVVPSTHSVLKVVPADAKGLHGLNAHGVIFDELHVQPTRELWDTLTTGVGARRQPMVIALTTAGWDRTSIAWEQHVYASQILSGTIRDPTYFAFIAAAPPNADWTDPQVWTLANPSLGVTIKGDYLKAEAAKAVQMPSYQNAFRRLHLCQWTEQANRFLDPAVWDENAGPLIREADLTDRICFGGLDMSTSQDLTAFVLVFPALGDPDEVAVLARFWVPEARLRDPGNRFREQYVAWAREGFLRTTPGASLDYGFIRQAILEDAQRFRLMELAMDVYFQGYQLGSELLQSGLNVVMVRTGMLSMSPPTKELERRTILRKVRHGGHPVLRWCVQNVAVRTDHVGNIMPDKSESQGRIDGAVALVLGLDRVMRQQPVTPIDFASQSVIIRHGPPPAAWEANDPLEPTDEFPAPWTSRPDTRAPWDR